MAKVGEGDSRWIVGNRADGKNVDNWHWTEKDLFPWFENQLQQQFNDVAIPSTKGNLKIDKLESVTGNMVVCNRKGKTFYVFDVKIKLNWSGSLKDNQAVTAKGTVNIEEIANDEDKWKFQVKQDDETAENRPLKDEVHSNVPKVVDPILNSVLEEMKGNSALDYKKKESSAEKKPSEPKAESKSRIIETSSSTTSSAPSKVTTKNFIQKIKFEVPPNILYECFIDQGRVSAFTGGAAKLENKVGTEFFLFDGAVSGKQVELVHPKKIVQTWRFNSWPADHHSQVTLQFDGDGSSTMLTLTQKGIPSSDFDRTVGGWDNYFWQRIRGLFGWNYRID